MTKEINLQNSKHKKTPLTYGLLGIGIVLFVGLFNISRNTSLRIVGDEFGYWTAGATFAGFDWTSVASYNGYYSFGYGIFLAPLLRLNIPQTLKYQMAIVLNVLMLVFVFYLLYRFLQKHGTAPFPAMLLALTGTLYTSNICYAQYTLAETFILALYTLITFLCLSQYSEAKVQNAVILPVALGLLYAAHQRTIGVVLVASVFYIIITLIKKRYRDIALFCLIFALVFVIYSIIKSNYQAFIHNYNDTNLASGQVSKVKALLTLPGFMAFIRGLCGKTAYTFLAGFSLAAIAVFRIVRDLIQELKAKNVRPITIAGCYLLANLIAMEMISALFLLNYTSRFDLITYGRYHDFTLSALIVYELYTCLIKKETPSKQLVLCTALCTIAVTVVSIISIPNGLPITHVNIFSPGVALFYFHGNHLWLMLLINLLFLFLYYRLSTRSVGITDQCLSISLTFVAAFVVMAAAALLMTYSWSIEGCTNEERLAKQITEDRSVESLWYYAPDSPIDVDFLQFLLNERSIICFDDVQVLSELGDKDFILTTANSGLTANQQWSQQYQLVGASSYLMLWKKVPLEIESCDYFDLYEMDYDSLPEDVLTGINPPEDNGTIWANGEVSLTLKDPYRRVFSLEGYVPFYPQSEVHELSIQILINSIPIQELTIACGEPFSTTIDCNDYKEQLSNRIFNDIITVSVVPSYTFRPADYGSDDHRVLSYIITKMSWKDGN